MKSRIYLIGILIMASCIQKKNRFENTLTKDQNLNTASVLSLMEFDPKEGKASATATAIASEAFGDKYKLPSFEIILSGATYVQIMRCAEEYRSFFQDAISDAQTIQDQKWPWVNALGTTDFCQIASRYYAPNKFYDTGANNGTFFYALNPCVNAETSKTGKDECSFNIFLTDKIDYNDSPSIAFVKKAKELNEAESDYDTNLAKLSALSKLLVQQKSQCQTLFDQGVEDQKQKIIVQNALALGGSALAGLTARAMLSKKFTEKVANNISNYQKTAQKISSLGEINRPTKWGIAAFIASGIAALSYQFTKKEASAPTPDTSCEKALEIAAQIQKIHESKILQKSVDKMIQISNELKEMYQFFDGYTEKSFGSNGRLPDEISD